LEARRSSLSMSDAFTCEWADDEMSPAHPI
jgi:hypothetical protein